MLTLPNFSDEKLVKLDDVGSHASFRTPNGLKKDEGSSSHDVPPPSMRRSYDGTSSNTSQFELTRSGSSNSLGSLSPSVVSSSKSVGNFSSASSRNRRGRVRESSRKKKLAKTRRITDDDADRVDMQLLDDVLREAHAAAASAVGEWRDRDSSAKSPQHLMRGGSIDSIDDRSDIIPEHEESPPPHKTQGFKTVHGDSIEILETPTTDNTNTNDSKQQEKRNKNGFGIFIKGIFGRGNKRSRDNPGKKASVTFKEREGEESTKRNYHPIDSKHQRDHERSNLAIFGGALDGDSLGDDDSLLSGNTSTTTSTRGRWAKSRWPRRSKNKYFFRRLFRRGRKFLRRHRRLLTLLSMLVSVGLAVSVGVFMVAIPA